MKQRGFTVVELIITITIMGILLLITVVNVNATQATARDDERRSDVESLALHLETFYTNGRDGTTIFGRYSSTGLTASGVSSIKENLRDIDLKSVMAPGITDPLQTLIMAPDNTPQNPTKDQYIYQPLKADGTLCTSGTDYCTKFIIYYRTEADNTVHTVLSKNQ
ncbi:MAG: type II secretion system protein [Candidatus Microsaccharimonas sp.]